MTLAEIIYTPHHSDYKHLTINCNWAVEYYKNGVEVVSYFDTQAEAKNFYNKLMEGQ